MPDQEASFADIEATLKRAAAALTRAGIPFLLGGSLASWARGGPETRHDLDLIVKPSDAERALGVLVSEGMRAEQPPEEWLLKAWDGDMLVDLIFAPSGLEVTDDVLERGEEMDVRGMRMKVMALEDVIVTKLLALDEHRIDFESLVPIARALREQIDWEAVRSRTAESPFGRAFFVLVDGLGILPDPTQAAGARVKVSPSPPA